MVASPGAHDVPGCLSECFTLQDRCFDKGGDDESCLQSMMQWENSHFGQPPGAGHFDCDIACTGRKHTEGDESNEGPYGNIAVFMRAGGCVVAPTPTPNPTPRAQTPTPNPTKLPTPMPTYRLGKRGRPDCPCIDVPFQPSPNQSHFYTGEPCALGTDSISVVTDPSRRVVPCVKLNYGSAGCNVHDSFEEHCDNSLESWCGAEWCYVDPNNCFGTEHTQTYLMEGATGDYNMFYSYATCVASPTMTNTTATPNPTPHSTTVVPTVLPTTLSLGQTTPGATVAPDDVEQASGDGSANECAPNPCLNGGSCTDRVNGFTCDCAAGWAGYTCETNIDECAPNPCQNGGSCTDEVNGFTCNCPAVYTGNTCQTETCRTIVDMDFNGNDYVSVYAGAGGTATCAERCLSDIECKAFTYEVPSKRCYLKNEASNYMHRPTGTYIAGLCRGSMPDGTPIPTQPAETTRVGRATTKRATTKSASRRTTGRTTATSRTRPASNCKAWCYHSLIYGGWKHKCDNYEKCSDCAECTLGPNCKAWCYHSSIYGDWAHKCDNYEKCSHCGECISSP